MSIYFFLFIIPLIFFLSFKISTFFKLYDQPDNNRKIHLKPTLITGGFFFELIFIIFFISFFIFENYHYFSISIDNYKDHFIILIVISLSFLIGLYDDKKNLNASFKLIMMYLIFFTSLFFLTDIYKIKRLNSFFEFNIYFDIYSTFFTSLCFVILLNAINMSDGINSLSSSIFLIWFIFITVFLPLDSFYFFINITLILSLVIFLIFNYKSKCFLGDSGCFVLASYFSYLVVYVYNNNLALGINLLNLESIFLLFLIPGIDMLRLFIERISSRRNPFQADRNHLHHKLLYKFGNLKTLIIYDSLIFFPWLIYLNTTSLLPYLIFIVIVIYCFIILKLQISNEKN